MLTFVKSVLLCTSVRKRIHMRFLVYYSMFRKNCFFVVLCFDSYLISL